MNAREAAYHALLSSLREEQFIQSFLEQWKCENNPDPRDYNFTQELAYGTMRRWRTLEYYAKQLAPLKLKRKEKALLLLALYQAKMMDKVPMHAIVNESVECAKKNCHHGFVKFLNAVLRKIPQLSDELPDDLGIRYSYPEFFVQELLKQADRSEVIKILDTENFPSKTMARIRAPDHHFETFVDTPFPMTILDRYIDSPDLYIQNVTPVTLIGECARHLPKPPRNILDLCASPGGKSLALHDLFPQAKLFMNDVSEAKIQRIQENLDKYQVEATLSISRGEEYPSDQKFDLIVLDVPCSNSGVLNKRPEARWRITPESLKELKSLQRRLLKHALTLLEPGGQLWFMTCSILNTEHDLPELENNRIFQKLIIPNKDGWDGGYTCIIKS